MRRKLLLTTAIFGITVTFALSGCSALRNNSVTDTGGENSNAKAISENAHSNNSTNGTESEFERNTFQNNTAEEFSIEESSISATASDSSFYETGSNVKSKEYILVSTIDESGSNETSFDETSDSNFDGSIFNDTSVDETTDFLVDESDSSLPSEDDTANYNFYESDSTDTSFDETTHFSYDEKTNSKIVAYGICTKDCEIKLANGETYELYRNQHVALLSNNGENYCILWYDTEAYVSCKNIFVFYETYEPNFTTGHWAGVIN